MSVNKPLPVISEAATVDERAYIHAQRPDAACGSSSGGLPRYEPYGIAKKLSVALSISDTVHKPDQLGNDDSINSARSGQGSAKLSSGRVKSYKVATSFYNSRLAPIRGGPVPKKSYHDTYQGVPLIDAKPAVAPSPPLSKKAKSSDATADVLPTQAMDTSTGGSSAPTSPKEPTAAARIEDLYENVYDRPRPATSAQMTAASTLRDQNSRPAELARVRTSHASSQNQNYRQSYAAAAHGMPRPRTAAQTMKTRQMTEWRDIHVKSLSRVDSILREAVGLSQANPNR
ncbi:hypothetical protein IWW50_004638, partial [Coemansia erecta]